MVAKVVDLIEFKPARDPSTYGKTDLLLGMGMVRRLGFSVKFTSRGSRPGQIEWELVTYNHRRRWVFPLAPNACDFVKPHGGPRK